MDISKILEVFYAEHKWSLVGDDYEGLHWDEDNSISKPTLEELTDKWNSNQGSIQNVEVGYNRQLEILASWPMEKQFEAITEFHMDRPEKLNELISHIELVKENNPKTS